MDAEIKQVLLSWNEKGRPYGNIMYIYDTMMVVDEALVKCEEILEEAGLGIGYTSRKSEVDRGLEGKRTLNYYIDALSAYADTALDQPLKKDFRENATETISRIHLEDFSVDNTVGLTQNTCISGGMYSPGTTLEQKKGKLTFADFIGTSDGKGSGNGFSMSFPNGCVEGFAEIFAGQYQALKASQMLGEDSELTQQEFLEQFYRQGEFTHDAGNPFLNFVSSVLDITIIKPVIEACTGEDLITGEDLSDLERGLKVVFAVVDLATLGGALAATKLSEVGAKEGLKVLGKTVAIDFAGNAAACGVGALGEAFDWPVPVTIMLSLAAGLTVSIAGNKLLLKNAEGVVIGEKVLDDGEIQIVRNEIEGGSKSPSEIAKSWQGSELYPGVDDYRDIVLNKGEDIYILESDFEVSHGKHSGYATTREAVINSGFDSKKLSESLQIKPYLDETAEEISEVAEYRSHVTRYTVNVEKMNVAYGEKTIANPQYGVGGNPQYYINNIETEIKNGNLIRGESYDLSNYHVSSDDYFRMTTGAKETYNGGN